MTQVNFPSNPSNGQEYTVNDVTYTWNGTYWEANNASSLYDRFVNIDGDTMTGDLTVPSLNGGPLSGFRNQFINGAMVINQRGTTTVTSTESVQPFICDRWYGQVNNHAINGDQTFEHNGTVNAVGLDQFQYAVRKASPNGLIAQAVELTTPDCNSQFPLGSVWTLSFYATTSTGRSVGENAGTFRSASSNRDNQVQVGPVTNVVITRVGTTAWYRHAYTFTVTGDASSSTATIICANFTIISEDMPMCNCTGAQLEFGTLATPFEHRPYGTELALCQRYFIRQELGGRIVSESSGMIKTGNGFDGHIYPYVNVLPPMRDVGGATNLVFDVSSLQCATRPNTVNGSSVVRTARLRPRGTGGHYQISLGCTNAPANSEFFVGMGGSYTVSAEL